MELSTVAILSCLDSKSGYIKLYMATELNCPNCNYLVQPFLATWCYKCPHCLFQSSDLKPSIDQKETMDETHRAQGIKTLRITNFKKILTTLNKVVPDPAGKKMLEVGSGHGWFLKEAKLRGWNVLGIEPSQKISLNTEDKWHDATVRRGLFPDVLNVNETYDILVFNDVFEHIPNIPLLIENCQKHLKSQGFLVINLPNSNGIFYRLATLLARFNFFSAFERLWQKDFSSPHVSYFNSSNIDSFVQRHGFIKMNNISLASLTREGLWARLRTDKKSRPLSCAAMYAMLFFIIPLLKILPNDIYCAIYQKRD